ncbi:putative F-box domain-containing protein, partial [Tanacetum coccineum]
AGYLKVSICNGLEMGCIVSMVLPEESLYFRCLSFHDDRFSNKNIPYGDIIDGMQASLSQCDRHQWCLYTSWIAISYYMRLSSSICDTIQLLPPCPWPGKVLGVKPHAYGSTIIVLLQDKEVESLQLLKDDQSGILFNGALHWFWFDYKNTSDKKILIASFDLAKEEFREIPQPDDSRYLWNFGYSLGIMDGRLCIYPLFDDADDFPSCGTWVIKNYNAEPSWELLLNDCGLSRSMDYIPSPIFVQTLVSPYVNNNRGPSHANNNKITANARSVQEMRDTTRNRRTGDELFPNDICRWGMCTKRQK